MNETTKKITYKSLGKDKRKPLGFISSCIETETGPVKARVAITSDTPIVIDVVQVSRNYISQNTEHSFYVNTQQDFEKTLIAQSTINDTTQEKTASEDVLININFESTEYKINSGKQTVDVELYEIGATV